MNNNNATPGQIEYAKQIAFMIGYDLEESEYTKDFMSEFISSNQDNYYTELEELKKNTKSILKSNKLADEEKAYIETLIEKNKKSLEELQILVSWVNENIYLYEEYLFKSKRIEALRITRALNLDYIKIEKYRNLDSKEKIEEYLDELQKIAEDINLDEKAKETLPALYIKPSSSDPIGKKLYHHHMVINTPNFKDMIESCKEESLFDDIGFISDGVIPRNKISNKLFNKIFEQLQIKKSFQTKEDKEISTNVGIEYLLMVGDFFLKEGKLQGNGYFYIPIQLTIHNNNLILHGSLKDSIAFNTALLEPTTSSKVIGSLSDVEDFLSENFVGSITWDKYYDFMNSCFNAVLKQDIQLYTIKSNNINYSDRRLKFILATKDTSSSANVNINNLQIALSYLENNQRPALIREVFSDVVQKQVKKDSYPLYQKSLHMDSQFPLDQSQKEALFYALQLDEGEILAVNGPPGTGKTAMLKAVISSEINKKLFQSTEPALIVACGSTNQSVTNIISSFGTIAEAYPENIDDITLSHRWIKGIQSYGWYFPSESKIKEESKGNSLENINILTKPFQKNWTPKFAAKKILNYCINDLQSMQKNYLEAFNTFSKFKESNRGEINSIEEALSYLEQYYNVFSIKKEYTDRLFNRLKKSLDELFSFIELDQIIENYHDEKLTNIVLDVFGIFDSSYRFNLQQNSFLIKDSVSKLKEYTLLVKNKQKSNVLELILDNILDVTFRERQFHCVMRIYEGRFLLKLDNMTSIKDEISLHDLAMLAPVIVSTFKSIPKLFEMWDSDNWMKSYRFNAADLLIVDEAGQATPEEGSAVFSLAKKAVVVGDTYQIEPVWSLDKNQEDTILQQLGYDDSKKDLCVKGLLCSESSVMKIAQRSSKFSYPVSGDEPRGLMLTRHYRCVYDIIQFCNELVYKNQLIPKIPNHKNPLFPPFSYVNVNASATKGKYGSWENYKEAEEIAKWICMKHNTIINFYKKEDSIPTIDELVAVVTPFSPQARLIKNKLLLEGKNKGIPTKILKNITVGTTHSLQGAERRIVLFSGVSSKDNGDSDFIDRSTSLLNVAVSRAQDTFVFFGNPGRFFKLDKNGEKPSNILSKYISRVGKKLYPRKFIAVESPTKANKISSWVDIDYHVFATKGHIYQLSDVDTRNYKPIYEPKEHIHEIDKVINELKDSDELIIATDDDREGESIAAHLLNRINEQLLYKDFKIKRIRMHEISKDVFKDSLENYETTLNMNTVAASESRSIIDFLIGKRFNELVQKRFKEQNLGYPPAVGRVKNLILHTIEEYTENGNQERYRILYKREINDNKIGENLIGIISFNNRVSFTFEEATNILKELEDKTDIEDSIIDSKTPTVSESRGFKIIKKPGTVDILKLSYEKFGYSPLKTMRLMQELYEYGDVKDSNDD